MRETKPLYRKVNRKSSWQNHNCQGKGGNFSSQRNTKASKKFEGTHLRMIKRGAGPDTGYDYTPLFHYLLMRIGDQWKDIYSDIKPRLNDTEPIFWIVSLADDVSGEPEYVRLGEASYWSRLYVNPEGQLQKVNPELESIQPFCTCHTHSFNGKKLRTEE